VRPRIGITCSWRKKKEETEVFLRSQYIAATAAAGGLPLLIPAGACGVRAGEWLEIIDGLVLSGGGDIEPCWYGEEPLPQLGEVNKDRDAAELELAKGALHSGLPVLGICRGAQILNVAAGGTLYQDIPAQCPSSLGHYQSPPRNLYAHKVEVAADSWLGRIIRRCLESRHKGRRLSAEKSEKGWRIEVNSFHHQAVRRLAPGFRVSAWSPDEIIEAIEGQEGFAVGVQWHPEDLWEEDAFACGLFESLVEMAGEKLKREGLAEEQCRER